MIDLLTVCPQIFAVVVGAMSAVTCVIYFIPFILRVGGIFIAGWNFILFILWIAVFGVFGRVRVSLCCHFGR